MPNRLLTTACLAAAFSAAPLALAQDDHAGHDHAGHDHDHDHAVEPAATQPAGDAPQIDIAELSYSIGFQLGAQLRRQGANLDPNELAAGVVDASTGAAPQVAPPRMAGYMLVYQRGLLQAQARAIGSELDAAEAAGDESRRAFLEERLRQVNETLDRQSDMIRNGQAGQQFLAENAQRDGVEVTTSGLQYEVLQPGDGAAPADGDTVVVHYQGTLLDGTEFDSSYARGEPATFELGPGKVIQGWTEGLQLVQPGGKIKLFIPPNLAYGPNGNGQIPPNATLVFEVELLEVNP